MRVAERVCRAVNAGLKVQLTEMGVVPEATLLRHPLMRLPAIEKVTFPATETEAVTVAETPFDNGSGTVNCTEIGADELLVIVRVEIAAISLPA